jgi:hypothetical protein
MSPNTTSRLTKAISQHHLTKAIKYKLAKLPFNQFSPMFLHPAVLSSWHRPKDMFPDPGEMEEHVEGGWNGKKITVRGMGYQWRI